MARGGKREGAGRKPGSATRKTREIAEAALTEGITPLEYMLSIMRDETENKANRMDMAKAAAPFIHPKLSSVEAKIDATVDATVSEVRRTVVDPRHPDA